MPGGLTVADNLAQLWRYFSLEYELFRSVIGWVPRIAAYEVKCTLVEHLHEDMRRTRALRERIADFGVFAPERRIDPGLANLVRHLLQAPFDGALVGAFYRVVKVEQAAAYRRHLHGDAAPERRADGGRARGPPAQAGPADRLGEGAAGGPGPTSGLLAGSKRSRRRSAASGGLGGCLAGLCRPAGAQGGVTGREQHRRAGGVARRRRCRAEEIAELTENARAGASGPRRRPGAGGPAGGPAAAGSSASTRRTSAPG